MFKVILLATFTISSGNDAYLRDHRAFEPFVNEPAVNHRTDGLRAPRRHHPSDLDLSEVHRNINSDTVMVETAFTNPYQNQRNNLRRHPNRRSENPVGLLHVIRPRTKDDNVVTYIYINRPKTNSTEVEVNTRSKHSIFNNTQKSGLDDSSSDFPYNGGNHDLNNSFNEHSSTNNMNTHHTINRTQDVNIETNNNGQHLPINNTHINRTTFNSNRNIHFEDENHNTGYYNTKEHNETITKDDTNINERTRVENSDKYPTKTTQDNEVTPKQDVDEDRWIWPAETTTAVPLVTLDDRGNFGADACPNQSVRLGQMCVPRT